MTSSYRRHEPPHAPSSAPPDPRLRRAVALGVRPRDVVEVRAAYTGDARRPTAECRLCGRPIRYLFCLRFVHVKGPDAVLEPVGSTCAEEFFRHLPARVRRSAAAALARAREPRTGQSDAQLLARYSAVAPVSRDLALADIASRATSGFASDRQRRRFLAGLARAEAEARRVAARMGGAEGALLTTFLDTPVARTDARLADIAASALGGGRFASERQRHFFAARLREAAGLSSESFHSNHATRAAHGTREQGETR